MASRMCSCCCSVRSGSAAGTSTGRTARWVTRTLAQWLRITPFHESVEEGAERLVLLREVVQHNAPILGLPLLPAARDLRHPRDRRRRRRRRPPRRPRRPRRPPLPARRRVGRHPPRHRRRPLRPHARRARAVGGGRPRARAERAADLGARAAPPPPRERSRARGCVLPVALLVLVPATAVDLAYYEFFVHRPGAETALVERVRAGAELHRNRAARAPFVAPGNVYRDTLRDALKFAAAPPIALFRAVNYALGGLCFVLLSLSPSPSPSSPRSSRPFAVPSWSTPAARRRPPPRRAKHTRDLGIQALADDDEAALALGRRCCSSCGRGGRWAPRPSLSCRRRWRCCPAAGDAGGAGGAVERCSAATTTAPTPPPGSRRSTAG